MEKGKAFTLERATVNPEQCHLMMASAQVVEIRDSPRLAETVILNFEPETKKCSDLVIKRQICDRQTQNLRLRDPLIGGTRFRNLGRICRDFSFFRGPITTPHILITDKTFPQEKLTEHPAVIHVLA